MRAQVDFQKSSKNRSFVRKQSNKKRRKETGTNVPELDFISNLCTGPGGGGKGVMKRELLMTKKPTSWLQGSLIPFTFFSTGGWTFPSGRGMAGDKDHVKTRFQRQNRLYCPILKFSSAWWVVRSHYQAFANMRGRYG